MDGCHLPQEELIPLRGQPSQRAGQTTLGVTNPEEGGGGRQRGKSGQPVLKAHVVCSCGQGTLQLMTGQTQPLALSSQPGQSTPVL